MNTPDFSHRALSPCGVASRPTQSASSGKNLISLNDGAWTTTTVEHAGVVSISMSRGQFLRPVNMFPSKLENH